MGPRKSDGPSTWTRLENNLRVMKQSGGGQHELVSRGTDHTGETDLVFRWAGTCWDMPMKT